MKYEEVHIAQNVFLQNTINFKIYHDFMYPEERKPCQLNCDVSIAKTQATFTYVENVGKYAI